MAHPVKKQVFEQAIESGPLFNKLVHAVSQHPDYIKKALQHVHDPFTSRLLSIFDSVVAEGIRQPLAMGIHRSDYMIHKGTKLQQVEINTISSAFGALSHRMSHLHTHLIHQWGSVKDGKYNPEANPNLLKHAALPNPSLDQIVDLFASALYAYCGKRKHNDPSSRRVAVLMVVQPGERNSVDQRWLQYSMEAKHQIHMLRHPLAYVARNGQLESDGTLILDGFEVGIAYYRAGYSPNDYPSELEWAARLTIERSTAIKCPNIAYHLVGTKKMQQVLAMPEQLETFIKNQEDVAALRACFAGLYSLDAGDNGVEEVIAKALEHPHQYVMKPQREGGGNLLANEEMVKALKTMTPEERSDYILMERIEPEAHQTILFRDSQFVITPCIAELGVFCLMLADKEELVNNSGGWLLRSKPENVEDGGVASGRAFLDSPYLY